MKYYGYNINQEYGHVKVTGPEGETWTEDTVKEAKESIDHLENMESRNEENW